MNSLWTFALYFSMILAGVTFATANKINNLSSCANELLRCRVDRLMECLLCQYTQFEVSYCSLCTLFVFVHCVRSSPRREALRRAIINNSEYHKHDYNYRTRGSEETKGGEKRFMKWRTMRLTQRDEEWAGLLSRVHRAPCWIYQQQKEAVTSG